MQVGCIWTKQGLAKAGATLVRPPGGSDVGCHGVGGEKIDVAVPAGGQHDRMGRIFLKIAGDQVATR